MIVAELFESVKFTDQGEWKAAVLKKNPKAEFEEFPKLNKIVAVSPEVENSMHGSQTSQTYGKWMIDTNTGVVY